MTVWFYNTADDPHVIAIANEELAWAAAEALGGKVFKAEVERVEEVCECQ